MICLGVLAGNSGFGLTGSITRSVLDGVSVLFGNIGDCFVKFSDGTGEQPDQVSQNCSAKHLQSL